MSEAEQVPRDLAPEPGSPTTARLAGLAVVSLIAVTAALQQAGAGRPSEPVPTAGAGDVMAEIAPPDTQFELIAKLMTKIGMWFDPDLRDAFAGQLDGLARTPEDVLRAAIVAAELHGGDLSEDALADVRERATAGSPLRRDAEIAEFIYRPPPAPDAPPAENGAAPAADAEMIGFVKRHGWIGRVAAARANGIDDADYQRLIGGGGAILGVLGVVFIGGGLATLLGLVLLVVAGLAWSRTPPATRLRPPPPGGSVFLETVAMFIAAFIALKLCGAVVAVVFDDDAATTFALVAQWTLLLTALWPGVRGVPLRRAFGTLGLHRGRGVLRELGSGVIGYIACLPFFIAGVLVSTALMLLWARARAMLGLPEGEPPSNPIVEIIAEQRGSWLFVMFALLAALWAPMAEETIFRGALYGHLRRRWHWFLAATMTALTFGLMHGYQFLMLGPVIGLGFGFALLREWRGSLIAPMTAHFIHNTTLLVVMTTILTMLGD
ncbi:MAG: lysostaphin resistance A-like protein [Phycisphaerales bacterium]